MKADPLSWEKDWVQQELSLRHLSDFVRFAWPVLEPGTPLVWGWHMDAICEHLQAVTNGEIRSLVINVPPGFSKSMCVAVMWPAWMWLHRPEWRSVFASYKDDLSVRDAIKSRDLITSEWYQRVFAPEWVLKPDLNNKTMYGNTRTGVRQALGNTGGATGFRGDAIVVDDPLKADEYPTAESLEKVISWWRFQMRNRLNDSQSGVRVIIMQRLHENDLAGYILRTEGYEHLCLPMEYDPARRCVTSIGFEDPRTKEGELLCPERFPESVVAIEKRTMGPYGWSGQYQQSPTPADGGIFKAWWLRYWYPADIDYTPPPETVRPEDGTYQEVPQAPLPSRMDVECQSWDLAFKGSTDADFVAGHVWGRSAGNFYMLDRAHDRLDFPATQAAILALTSRWPRAVAKYVEDKANGPAIISTLQGKIPGIEAVTPEGGKEARAHAVAPLFAAGNVWLPHPVMYPWVREVVKELTLFPRGQHDDDVDACTQALLKLMDAYDPTDIDLGDGGTQVSRWRV